MSVCQLQLNLGAAKSRAWADEVEVRENGIVRKEDCPLFLSGELTHTHSFWQCFLTSLHNMYTHQRPVGELTEQEARACTREHFPFMLAECLTRSTLDMQLCECICAHSNTCVCLWRCVCLYQCSECSQQCTDGCAAWMTPPVDSGLGARTQVIT